MFFLIFSGFKIFMDLEFDVIYFHNIKNIIGFVHLHFYKIHKNCIDALITINTNQINKKCFQFN